MHGGREKKSTAPAGGDERRRDALGVPPSFTNVFGPRRGAGGGLVVVESTSFSFRCRLLDDCGAGWSTAFYGRLAYLSALAVISPWAVFTEVMLIQQLLLHGPQARRQ